MNYPADIAKIIFKNWNRLAKSWKQPARPNEDELTQLLDLCFYASLKEEEGRPTRFSLLLEPDEGIPPSPFRFSRCTLCYSYVPFKTTRRLTVGEIVRLAPACNPSTTSLTVRSDHKHGWSLTGTVDEGDRATGYSMALQALRISSFKPGHLHVTLHGVRLCTLKDGKIIEHEPEGLVNEGFVQDFFRTSCLELGTEIAARCSDSETAQSFLEGGSDRHNWPMGYLRQLDALVSGLEQTDHGGCLLFVQEPQRAIEDLDIKYDVSQEPQLWNQLIGLWVTREEANACRETKPTDPEVLDRLNFREADIQTGLRDGLNNLIQLTSVDGAVVVDMHFRALGFGAVIRSEAKDFPVFSGRRRDRRDFKQLNPEDFGTRHRSAIRFCYAQKALAIIASHDGGLKMAVREGDAMFLLEDPSFDLSTEI